MSKLFNKFREDVDKRNEKIFKVIELSNRLQRELGITDDEIKELESESGTIPCGAYEVIGVHRDFKPWICVLEIIEKGSPYRNGISDPGVDFQPSWMSDEDCQGCSSINLPPDHVINEVIYYIKENN